MHANQGTLNMSHLRDRHRSSLLHHRFSVSGDMKNLQVAKGGTTGVVQARIGVRAIEELWIGMSGVPVK